MIQITSHKSFVSFETFALVESFESFESFALFEVFESFK